MAAPHAQPSTTPLKLLEGCSGMNYQNRPFDVFNGRLLGSDWSMTPAGVLPRPCVGQLGFYYLPASRCAAKANLTRGQIVLGRKA
jgi:hypothetical protein